MKILVSVSYYSPHISGLTNSTKNLSELLVSNGYRVRVLTVQHNKNLKSKEIINGVEVRRVPYLFKFHKGFILLTFVFSAFHSIWNSDHVLINLPQAEGFILAIIAKILRKKVHSIYHCDININKIFGAKIIEFLLKVTNNICLYLSDTIIVSSEDFAKQSKISGKYKNKIRYINLVIPSPIISKTEKNKLIEKIPQKQYLIGFLGRIAEEKGIEHLLNSIPELKAKIRDSFLIVMTGPKNVVGEQKYFQKIRMLLDKYKDSIFILGELKDDQLGAFYSLIDVLVLPSVNSTEAFGMVQVEAMLCGTPVVVSDLPGVRVPVRTTGMGEISNIGNTKDLANKIIKVLKNKEKYIENKKIIAENFSLNKIAGQYKEILK